MEENRYNLREHRMCDVAGCRSWSEAKSAKHRDGKPNLIHEDVDGDGQHDLLHEDIDNDGVIDAIHEDLDGDGVADLVSERHTQPTPKEAAHPLARMPNVMRTVALARTRTCMPMCMCMMFTRTAFACMCAAAVDSHSCTFATARAHA
eukprot:6190028-Pleurochrysis_carterae.AAC.5